MKKTFFFFILFFVTSNISLINWQWILFFFFFFLHRIQLFSMKTYKNENCAIQNIAIVMLCWSTWVISLVPKFFSVHHKLTHKNCRPVSSKNDLFIFRWYRCVILVWFGLVCFLCLMAYQSSWVIQCQIHPCMRTAITLFNS